MSKDKTIDELNSFENMIDRKRIKDKKHGFDYRFCPCCTRELVNRLKPLCETCQKYTAKAVLDGKIEVAETIKSEWLNMCRVAVNNPEKQTDIQMGLMKALEMSIADLKSQREAL